MKVSVVLATFNGSQFLEQQLDSILKQTVSPCEVVISDDGSTDNTFDIIKSKFRSSLVPYRLYKNKFNLGPKNNFSKAISLASGDYISLSDQDDVWQPNKLKKLLDRMEELESKYGKGTPLLVFSDLEVVDNNLISISHSFFATHKFKPNHIKLPSLLVENITPGCAMLINRPLADLAIPIPNEAMMHDAWLMISANLLGYIGYVNCPLLSYRQHDNNVLGSGGSINKLKLFENIQLAKKSIQGYIEQSEAALDIYFDMLDNSDKEFLNSFKNISTQGFFRRKKYLFENDIKKSSLIKSMIFYSMF